MAKSSATAIGVVTNATELVRNLDSKAIRERLDELDREREALLILMRAAVRAEKDGVSRGRVNAE
jgi:hypothetical protein